MTTLLAGSAILFLATLAHATFGFGSGLIAMPLLTLLVGIQTAAPVTALSMMTTIAILLWRGRASVDFAAAWRLLLSSALGIPIGLFVLKSGPAGPLAVLLGVLLVAYASYSLARPHFPPLRGDLWVYVFGFVAGVFGGAFNTNGPPVVVYGALSRWSPERFRATLQAYFLPAEAMICAGHALAGMWTGPVLRLAAAAVPAVLVAIFLGQRLARVLPPHRFARLLNAICLLLGVVLLVASLR